MEAFLQKLQRLLDKCLGVFIRWVRHNRTTLRIPTKRIRFQKINRHINVKKELPNGDRIKFLTNSITDEFTTTLLRTYNNALIYTTAPTDNSNINQVTSIRDFINIIRIGNKDESPLPANYRYAFFFFSYDEDKNLYDTLELLEELYNLIMEMDMSLRKHIIDSIDIFLKCNYEHASLFIDATLNKMLENTYFKFY